MGNKIAICTALYCPPFYDGRALKKKSLIKKELTGKQSLVGDKTPLKQVAVITAPAAEWAERSHIKMTMVPSATVVPGAGLNDPYDVTPTMQLAVVLNFTNFETIQAKNIVNFF